MDEFALIEEIRRLLARDHPRVVLGIGDDAALLAPSAKGAVLTVDVAVEGVHFDARWLPFEDVGYRAYVAALSDLAAMGAAAVAGLSSLVLPAGRPEQDVLALVRGLAAAADEYGAPIVGGNVSSGGALVVSLTAIGDAPPRPLRRDGARVGDRVYVTGTVGAAALGWRLLQRRSTGGPEAAPFVARWRRPRARFDVLDRLADVATAAIDVSDGVLQDLGHVCERSGVGAEVEIEHLPLDPGAERLAGQLGLDAVELALSGGEDYELLFTAPPGALEPAAPWATNIGEIVEGGRVRAVDATGRERASLERGHRHRL